MHRGHAARDLDVHAHADAELDGVAALAPSGLVGPELGVAGRVERLVEGRLVVADVVRLADHGRVGLEELRDEVRAPHVGRVLADLGGEQVHRPLDRRRRFRAAGAPIGDDRRRVRDHRRRLAFDVGDRVDAGRHGAGHERCQDRAHLGVRTGVLEHVEAVGQDLAVAVAADRDVLHLGAPVPEGHHALAAGLLPAHRPPDLLGQPAEHDLFGIHADLGAEPAADIWRDDPELTVLQAVGRRQRTDGALGVLRRQPLHEPFAIPRRGGSAHLERTGRDALVEDPLTDDDLALGEELVAGDARHAEERGVEHDVAAGRRIEMGRAGRGAFDVDEHLQHVVVDDHRLSGILTLVRPLGHDGGDRLTDVADDVHGEERSGHVRIERRRERLETEIGTGEDADDARLLERRTRVDRQDAGMSGGRADVGHVRRAGEQRLVAQVVQVHTAGREELRIFLAKYTIAENAAGHLIPLSVSTSSGHYRRRGSGGGVRGAAGHGRRGGRGRRCGCATAAAAAAAADSAWAAAAAASVRTAKMSLTTV